MSGEAPNTETVRAHELYQSGRAVEAHIGARDAHCNRVDVAGDHPATQHASRRNGEHAGSGPDVENCAARSALPAKPDEGALRRRPARLHDPIERQKAAARGAVMTGAEGKRG